MSRLAQMLYLDVTIRTSGFAWLLGLATALLAGYGTVDWHTGLAIAATVLGLVVVQGFEHALDVIHDQGGYSAFRDKSLMGVAQRYIRRFPLVMVALVATLAAAQRYWLIFIGLAASRMALLYVLSHNEWYATAGFMLAYATGYFSATNTPSLAFLAGFIMTGFLYKASLSMYRLDDYLEGELPSREAIIQYYRNVFRYTLHYVPPLVAILLVAVTHPLDADALPWWAPLSWLLGWGAMALPMLRYKGHLLNQEAPVHMPVLGVMAPELVAAYHQGMLAVYAPLYVALLLILLAFWVSRHAMCNVTACPLNPLLGVDRPR